MKNVEGLSKEKKKQLIDNSMVKWAEGGRRG